MFENNENDKLEPAMGTNTEPTPETAPEPGVETEGAAAPEPPVPSAPVSDEAQAQPPAADSAQAAASFSGEPLPSSATVENPGAGSLGQENIPPYYPSASAGNPPGSTPVPPVYGNYPNMQQPPVYSQPPQPGVQPGPNDSPQQSQWTFNDYGPIGGPSKPKKPKKERDAEKRVPGNGTGVKVLAIVMSALFVVSVAGFTGYLIYDNNRSPSTLPDGNIASSEPYHIQDAPEINSNPSTPVITGDQMSPAELYKAVEPAVVGVVGYMRSTTTGIYEAASQGSGVVFDANGYIITNRHVIRNSQTEQNWDRVEVIRTTGETYTAEVLGTDRETDLAVLKIEETDLAAAVMGNSDTLEVGDQAFVIGNPSGLEYAGSLAGGYISAVNRAVLMESTGARVELIQTDAAINPGNSGGALVNIYGQVIGITSAKLVGEEYEGMGFAIPINNVKPIVESLVDNGYVTGRVQIGLQYSVIEKTIADLNGIPQGLRVVTVDPASDAFAKGLQVGDIIYKMDDAEVHDTPDVKQALLNKNPGDQVVLWVYRVGLDGRAQKLELTVTLQEKAPDE